MRIPEWLPVFLFLTNESQLVFYVSGMNSDRLFLNSVSGTDPLGSGWSSLKVGVHGSLTPVPTLVLSSPSDQMGEGEGRLLPIPGLLDYGNNYVGLPVRLVTQRLGIFFVCYKSTYPGRRQKCLTGVWDPQAL